ncbi:teichoic acid ABC transporter ATP-binding protein, partial [Staphylococcus pseudintermedius]
IHYGQMVVYDDVNVVIKRYNALVQKIKHMPKSEQVEYKKKKLQQQQVGHLDEVTISQKNDVSLMTHGLIGVTLIGWFVAMYFQLFG